MAEKILALLLCLMLLCPAALCETAVERTEGEAYFPEEENWTYHFSYAYPHLTGDDLCSALVNDTYDMILSEMLYTSLPMFAESALEGDKVEVRHDFTVTCNNGRFLSIVQNRWQTMEGGGEMLVMEPLTFDTAGEYLGETLTLRGLVMVGDSSVQLAAALMPVLYERFLALQEEGVARRDVTQEEFEAEFSPMSHFFADENGNAVFFFPPMLLETPTFEVPLFPFTPEELEALL